MQFWPILAASILSASLASPFTRAQQSFAPPQELSSADGKFTGILYPSPRLHDIDGDGAPELVIGDLRGYVRFSEKLDGGALAWSKLANVEQGKKPLKLFNW